MAATTDGEKLFLHIRDRVLPELDAGTAAGERSIDAFAAIGGTEKFGEFLRGAIAIHALRRLLVYWDAERPNVGEAMHVTRLSRFLRTELFLGLNSDEAATVARLAVAAHEASNKQISPGVRKRVIGETLNPYCYLCGTSLRTSVPASSPDFLTLEHLWPSSLGGNSVEDNLLPACSKCQNDKGDHPSWEWFSVHDLVLSPTPSDEELRSVPRRAKIAVHFMKALEATRGSSKTLKESMRALGPVSRVLAFRDGGDMPITFFHLRTYPTT